MTEEIALIVQKARELSVMIKGHEISKKYSESLYNISRDRKAQNLLSKLINLGRTLTEGYPAGAHQEDSAEQMLLKAELEECDIVKQHLVIQREYLNLLKNILARIKDPI